MPLCSTQSVEAVRMLPCHPVRCTMSSFDSRSKFASVVFPIPLLPRINSFKTPNVCPYGEGWGNGARKVEDGITGCCRCSDRTGSVTGADSRDIKYRERSWGAVREKERRMEGRRTLDESFYPGIERNVAVAVAVAMPFNHSALLSGFCCFILSNQTHERCERYPRAT